MDFWVLSSFGILLKIFTIFILRAGVAETHFDIASKIGIYIGIQIKAGCDGLLLTGVQVEGGAEVALLTGAFLAGIANGSISL